MRRKKYDLEFFKNLAIERGGECLSIEYIDCTKKLAFVCSIGHTWETKAYYLVNNNTWCPHCNKFHKDNIDVFKKIADERNGFCLSDKYINAKSKLKFMCSEGHVWESKAHDVKYSKSWCPVCSNSLRLTIEEMREIAVRRKGKCLSDEYINSHTKLLWECENGHTWFAKPCSIKNSNNWCPICNESLGERKIAEYLIRNKIPFEREKKFDGCRGIKQMLPFDFYLSEFNILIEHDGKQHYVPVNFYGCSNEEAQKTFVELTNNDKIKEKYCLDNNIRLIRVSYKIKNIEEYLNNALK